MMFYKIIIHCLCKCSLDLNHILNMISLSMPSLDDMVLSK